MKSKVALIIVFKLVYSRTVIPYKYFVENEKSILETLEYLQQNGITFNISKHLTITLSFDSERNFEIVKATIGSYLI
jgi:hypothetical protein